MAAYKTNFGEQEKLEMGRRYLLTFRQYALCNDIRIKNKNGGMGIPQVRSLVAFAKAYLRPAALSMYSFSIFFEYHRKW